MSSSNPDDAALEALLRGTRTIALVGASPDPRRPSHGVMSYLLSVGYEVTPIRPGGGEVLGVPCVASLRDLAAPPDLVDVFRAPEHVPGVVDDALAVGARALWLQDGVIHEAAAERARAAGLQVVMDDCTLRVHRRLLGR
ncbi:MAG: CoA-binding protein [Planctomycetota bacterium]